MIFSAFFALAVIVFIVYAISKGSKTISSSGTKNEFQSWWVLGGQSGAGNSWSNFSSGSGSFSGFSGGRGGGHFGGFGGGSFGGGGASGSW